MKLEIVLYPDPRLKQPSVAIAKVDDEVRKLLEDMAETMYAAPGIGLAAPQIGKNVRVIVVDIGADEEAQRAAHLYKLVNPKIVKRKGSIDWEEGCLSIPGIHEFVKRSDAVVVEALDETGQKVILEASGLLAVCLQHEIDHLDGVLFIDRLSRLKRELLRPKLKALQQEQHSEQDM